jgi:hypothetical protein
MLKAADVELSRLKNTISLKVEKTINPEI